MDVKAYLLQDRQWPREHRISHAQYQMKIAKSIEGYEFWKAVLQANLDI